MSRASIRRSSTTWPSLASRLRVPLGFVLAAIYLWRAQPTRVSLAAGLPLAAAGLLLRGAAAGHIRKNDVLATTGPYRFTRNPLYLGSTLLAAGFVIAAADWLMAALATAMLVAIYWPVMRREEAFLAERFGADYLAWAREVPRFFPQWAPPARSSPRAPARFSPALYRRHREYNALVGFVLVTAVVVAKYWLRP